MPFKPSVMHDRMRDKLTHFLNQGYSVAQTARIMEKSRQLIYYWVKKLKLTVHHKEPAIAVRTPVTNERKEKILSLIAEGKSQVAVAAEVGVSKQYVNQLVKRSKK